MSRRQFLGVFDDESGLIAATTRSREMGLSVVDAFTPYAVHGLDRAMGLPPSWLPWACFGLGTAGFLFATWFQFWTTAVDWPVNVGGRPWNSLPAFVPVMFELMVLSAGVGVVLVFLAARKLWPGREADVPHPRVTDDRFVLVLDADASDPRVVRRLLTECGAVDVEERDVEVGR
jgi:hypothetical protein